MINKAEGEKQALILEGDGLASQILNQSQSLAQSIIEVGKSVDLNQ